MKMTAGYLKKENLKEAGMRLKEKMQERTENISVKIKTRTTRSPNRPKKEHGGWVVNSEFKKSHLLMLLYTIMHVIMLFGMGLSIAYLAVVFSQNEKAVPVLYASQITFIILTCVELIGAQLYNPLRKMLQKKKKSIIVSQIALFIIDMAILIVIYKILEGHAEKMDLMQKETVTVFLGILAIMVTLINLLIFSTFWIKTFFFKSSNGKFFRTLILSLCILFSICILLLICTFPQTINRYRLTN
ncbi:hypothetical protein NEFER03_1435 [Nematocida sp. LUAm3]|nr:hypothetical protein NEFER03_1435 [Nematocida sp. LUAm3]